jgi:adenylate cyclase
VDVKKVGRELGVRYVLEGSVRRAGERLRVTVQLVNAASGAHIWADAYDRSMADLFDVQDDITQRTAGAIEPSIKQAEIERARRKRPEKLEAYDHYLRALPHLYSASREGNEEACKLLKQSLAAEPNFADAAAALGTCLLWRIPNGWAVAAEVGPEIKRHFQLALKSDKQNSDALAWSARAAAPIDRKYSEAMILAERAVAANPNSAVAWTNKGWVCVFAEDPTAALPDLEHAVRLSPLDPFAWDTWVGIAIAYVQLGEDEKAIAAARRAVNQNLHHAWAHRVLAISLALAGKREEAVVATKEAIGRPDFFDQRISGMESIYPRKQEICRRHAVRRIPGLRTIRITEFEFINVRHWPFSRTRAVFW